MRLYSLINFYISDLQRGLQTAHCVSEISTRYVKTSPEHDVFEDWAINHKTIIILNGGNSAMLRSACEILGDSAVKLNLPWSAFHEDENSLDGALTSVAIIVGPEIYAARIYPEMPESYIYFTPERKGIRHHKGSAEFALCQFLQSMRLA